MKCAFISRHVNAAVAGFGLVFFTSVAFGQDADLALVGNWEPLPTGNSLEGWKVRGGFATYKAQDGVIIGSTAEGSPNTFLCIGSYSDFVLEFDVFCDKELNSGVQIRSHVYDDDGRKGVVYGYQCEIAPADFAHCGNFWDESRHDEWWDDFANKPEAQKAYKVDRWNHYRIAAQGDHIRSWINGVACADFHDKTDSIGLIGLQVHAIKKGTGPYRVRWRNLRIQELKRGETVK
jgi:hypothetical protein